MTTSYQTLTDIAFAWGIRCFGSKHMSNKYIRALRTAEEVIELCQACEVDGMQLHRLIDYVYAKEPGKIAQEIGGVLVTSAVFCSTMGLEPDFVLATEVRRVLEKSPEYFAERNRLKEQAGFD
jgi:hypothetical protein